MVLILGVSKLKQGLPLPQTYLLKIQIEVQLVSDHQLLLIV